MSDSFADLWNSTTPVQPSKPTPLSGQKPSTASSYTQPKPKNDVFALLSQSSTPNYSNSYRSNSSLNGSNGGSRSLTPANNPSRPTSSLSSKPAAASSSSTDAFNDLFGSLGGGSSSTSTSNMTIAERAALAEKQRLASTQSRTPPAPAPNHAWAGLDALGGGSSFSTPSASNVTSQEDEWGLGDFTSPPTTKPPARQRQAPKQETVDLFDFGDTNPPRSTSVKAAPSQNKPSTGSGSLWDMDEFMSSSASPAPAAQGTTSSQKAKQEAFDSPDLDFDFGNREDRDESPANDNADEDDILGMLSKPVEAVRAQSVSSFISPVLHNV